MIDNLLPRVVALTADFLFSKLFRGSLRNAIVTGVNKDVIPEGVQ